MRVSLGIVTAGMAAASLTSPLAIAQVTVQHARPAQAIIVQKGGGYLGIGGLEVTAERMKSLNLKEERGVEVSSVAEGGPAAKAGVHEGDVVLEFNGFPVQGTVQFQRMVGETPPGRQVKLTIWRNNATQTVTATIGERKGGITTMAPEELRTWTFDPPAPPAAPRMPEMNVPRFEMLMPSPALGIYGEPMGNAEQLAEFFGVSDGILVRSVVKGSAAERAGIKAGDVITKIEDTHIASTGDISRTLRTLRSSKSTFTVTVVRNKKEMPITVTLDTGGNTTRASLVQVNC